MEQHESGPVQFVLWTAIFCMPATLAFSLFVSVVNFYVRVCEFLHSCLYIGLYIPTPARNT